MFLILILFFFLFTSYTCLKLNATIRVAYNLCLVYVQTYINSTVTLFKPYFTKKNSSSVHCYDNNVQDTNSYSFKSLSLQCSVTLLMIIRKKKCYLQFMVLIIYPFKMCLYAWLNTKTFMISRENVRNFNENSR